MEKYAPLLVWVAIFGLMWFFWIRPQQVRSKERKEMLDALEKGDRVVTIGGIHGTVTSLQADVIRVRIADRVEIKLSRNGIGHRVENETDE